MLVVDQRLKYQEGFTQGLCDHHLTLFDLRHDFKETPKKKSTKKLNCGPGAKQCGNACIPKEHKCHAGQDKISPGQLNTIVARADDSIRNIPDHEEAYIIDPQTGQVEHHVGGKDHVNLPSDGMQGKIVTHNHPPIFEPPDSPSNDGVSFSPADIGTAISGDLYEIRAVSKKYSHSMKPPEGGWQHSISAQRKYQAAYDNAYRRAYDDAVWKMFAKGQSEARVNADFWHQLWTRFAKKTGAQYQRTEVSAQKSDGKLFQIRGDRSSRLRSKRKNKPKCGPGSKLCGGVCIPKGHKCLKDAPSARKNAHKKNSSASTTRKASLIGGAIAGTALISYLGISQSETAQETLAKIKKDFGAEVAAAAGMAYKNSHSEENIKLVNDFKNSKLIPKPIKRSILSLIGNVRVFAARLHMEGEGANIIKKDSKNNIITFRSKTESGKEAFLSMSSLGEKVVIFQTVQLDHIKGSDTPTYEMEFNVNRSYDQQQTASAKEGIKLLRITKRMFEEHVKEIPEGSIVETEPHKKDGKQRGRESIFTRSGFSYLPENKIKEVGAYEQLTNPIYRSLIAKKEGGKLVSLTSEEEDDLLKRLSQSLKADTMLFVAKYDVLASDSKSKLSQSVAAIKGIIDSVYRDEIDKILKLDIDGSQNITGSFLAEGEVYNFNISPSNELSYVEAKEQPNGRIQRKDSKLSNRKKQCKKGKPCGSTCIQKGIQCKRKLNPKYGETLNNIRQSLSGIKGQSPTTKKAAPSNSSTKVKTPLIPLGLGVLAAKGGQALVLGSATFLGIKSAQYAKKVHDYKNNFEESAERAKIEAAAYQDKVLPKLATGVVSLGDQNSRYKDVEHSSGSHLNHDEEPDQITFAVGGFGSMYGAEGEHMAYETSQVLPKHLVVGIENPEFDVDPGEEGETATSPSFIKRAFKTIVTGNIEKGHNPVAVRMAARAYAYHKQYPDKPLNLVGQSGGTMVVHETYNILQAMGVKDVKVAAFAGPYFGLSSGEGITLCNPKTDPLAKIIKPFIKNPVVVNSAAGHSSYMVDVPENSSLPARAKERSENNAKYQPNLETRKILLDYFKRDRKDAALLHDLKPLIGPLLNRHYTDGYDRLLSIHSRRKGYLNGRFLADKKVFQFWLNPLGTLEIQRLGTKYNADSESNYLIGYFIESGLDPDWHKTESRLLPSQRPVTGYTFDGKCVADFQKSRAQIDLRTLGQIKRACRWVTYDALEDTASPAQDKQKVLSESLPVIIEALNSVYLDQIDTLKSVDIDPDGTIKGVFSDENTNYDFEISPSNKVSYNESDSGLKTDAQPRVLISLMRRVYRADKKNAKRHCTQGKPCGGTCIQKGLQCNRQLASKFNAPLANVRKNLLGLKNPTGAKPAATGTTAQQSQSSSTQAASAKQQNRKPNRVKQAAGIVLSSSTRTAVLGGIAAAAFTLGRDSARAVSKLSIRTPPDGIPDEQTRKTYDSFQKGDILRRNFDIPGVGTYTHYAVYAGRNEKGEHEVIEVAGETAIVKRNNIYNTVGPGFTEFEKVPEEEMMKGKPAFSPDEIVNRAESLLGIGLDYDLTTNNCESFARGCVEGETYSTQGDPNKSTKFTKAIIGTLTRAMYRLGDQTTKDQNKKALARISLREMDTLLRKQIKDKSKQSKNIAKTGTQGSMNLLRQFRKAKRQKVNADRRDASAQNPEDLLNHIDLPHPKEYEDFVEKMVKDYPGLGKVGRVALYKDYFTAMITGLQLLEHGESTT